MLAPGVYVQEVPSAIKPIAGVSTSTAGFIGVVPNTFKQITKDPAGTVNTVPATTAKTGPGTTSKTGPDDAVQAPTKWVEFTVPTLANTARLITNWTQFTTAFGDLVGDPATPAAANAAGTDISEGHRHLAHAVYGFFNNGGSRCFVVRIAGEDNVGDGLKALAAIDEIAVVAAPGLIRPAARSAIVADCELRERFAILDGPATAPNTTTLTTAATGSDAVEIPTDTNYAAWYFPWIKVFDPATKLKAPKGDGTIGVPPSGHLAGIYARVDAGRGVHKAPANEAVVGALDVTQAISRSEQAGLNPKGVNCIRMLNGNIVVWGARTVGGDVNADLKYINVRRTLLFLRKSLEQGTQWVVFEPNSPALWQQVSRNVTAFLTTVWRSGALFGTTAAEAFYVKCDAENNLPDLREQGQLVIEVGVAIVRPAEFVIFRISQLSASSE